MPTPAELAADAEEQIAAGAEVPGLAAHVTTLVRLKAQLDALEQQRKSAQGEYDALRKTTIPALLHGAGVTSARFLSGTLSLRARSYASVSKGKRQEALEWLRFYGHDDVLKIDGSSLRELVDELVASGQPVPDFVQLFTEETAVLTAPRGAKSNE